MRSRLWARTFCAVAVGAFVIGMLAASAPAGNRAPNAQQLVFPGPTAEVTYGKSVAFTVRLFNTQSSNYTHIRIVNPAPFTYSTGQNNQPVKNFATFKYSSCPGPKPATGAAFVSNDLGQLSPGPTPLECTLVWQTPTLGSSADDPETPNVNESCGATKDENGNGTNTPEPCITNAPYWTIKEGTGNLGSNGPDTFRANVVGVHFLLQTNIEQARGYEIDGCSDVNGSGSLSTGPLGSGNPFRASVCVRAASLPGGTNFAGSPGLVQTISERNHQSSDNKGFTQVAEICIPSPPTQSCGTPWPMSPPGQVKLEFDTRNTPTPRGENIDRIFHDAVGDGQHYEDVTETCQVTLINSTKVLIAICPAPSNGRWTGG